MTNEYSRNILPMIHQERYLVNLVHMNIHWMLRFWTKKEKKNNREQKGSMFYLLNYLVREFTTFIFDTLSIKIWTVICLFK